MNLVLFIHRLHIRSQKNFFFYRSGYTVQHYRPLIDSIQTELPTHIRADLRRRQYAIKYARTFMEYMKFSRLWGNNQGKRASRCCSACIFRL